MRAHNFVDLTGRHFGSLTVTQYLYTNNLRKPVWLCTCICGESYIKTSVDLRRGMKRCMKCGWRKGYEISLEDGLCKIPLTNTKDYGYTDGNDLDVIRKHLWHLDVDGYIRNSFGKILSRILLGVKDKKIFVDHIDHNLLNNKRDNLRAVTNSQNEMNRICKNPLGAKGIRHLKNKYFVNIKVRGINIKLGSFYRLESALKTRADAEEKYFGEYICKI